MLAEREILLFHPNHGAGAANFSGGTPLGAEYYFTKNASDKFLGAAAANFSRAVGGITFERDRLP